VSDENRLSFTVFYVYVFITGTYRRHFCYV